MVSTQCQFCSPYALAKSNTNCPFQGYYNNPEATSQTLDKEGFIHSGDLGYFDDENLLHIIDRKKDTIKNNAYQIAPAVIENIIFELESVENCCVVGIYDGLRHDLICAFVKRKDKSLTEEDVSNHVNGECRLDSFRVDKI